MRFYVQSEVPMTDPKLEALVEASKVLLKLLAAVDVEGDSSDVYAVGVGEEVLRTALAAIEPSPEHPPCVGRDPLCPCQDGGDACHYLTVGDSPAMKPNMSVLQQFLVYCDNNHDVRCPYFDECASEAAAETTTTAVGARAWMKRDGWVIRNGRDLCGICKGLNQKPGVSDDE